MRLALLPLLCILCFDAHADELSAKDIAKNSFPAFVSIATFDSIQNPIAIGSGFFISPQNIVTNFHVISGASFINARLSEQNKTFRITGIVALDEKKDLAILRTDKPNSAYLKWGDSDSMSVGEKIYALGNPQGLEGTFSEGIISSLRKSAHLLQITAPISPGSSGGPVFNTSGDVVGVAVAYMKSGQNLNFAVPINELKSMVSSGSEKVVKHVEVQEAKADQSEPIKISKDLTVTDHWFFVGFLNGQSKASYVKSNAKAIKPNQSFGIRFVYQTALEKVHTKLILNVPEKAENFRYRSKDASVTFSPDHKSVTVETFTPGSKGSAAYYWGVDSKDPLGSYSIQLYVEGKLVESHDFVVESLVSAPVVEVPKQDGKSEDRITVETIRANAGMCVNETMRDEPYSYMKAFANMLLYARLAREENEVALRGKVDQSLQHLDKANQFFACGMLQVAEYRDSKDSNISISADATVNSLNQLYAVNGLMREQFKKALNGESMARGDMADMVSQMSMASDDAWKKLLPEGLIITHSMVDSGKQGALTISKKEKSELIATLEKAVKKNYKKDNRALEVTVKYLVEFFNQKWTLATK